MLKRFLLGVPAIAALAVLTTRLVPGPQKDRTTLLPSGWRIRPAGRQVPVGTLPLNLLTLSDGSVLVTNNGYGANGLMRIEPVTARLVWRLPLKAAWLGLARSGRDWRDTVWASGGGTNQVYRLVWLGGGLWNYLSLERAATALRRHGQVIDEGLLTHVAPVHWNHINLTGDYTWRPNKRVEKGGFRSLRPVGRRPHQGNPRVRRRRI